MLLGSIWSCKSIRLHDEAVLVEENPRALEMPETVMSIWEEKAAFNARAKASMQEFLRSKSWEEKVESIERMNVAGKMAREAMRKTLDGRPESSHIDHAEEVR